MLVSNTVFKNRYVYNGQTNFPISFPFLDKNHVEVWWSAPGGSDLDAKLVDRNTFTITGEGNPSGGVLTRTGTWQQGITIAIVRNIPITQLHQYTQYDDFPAESHEDALAKLTMICQQLDEVVKRAMTVPVTSDKNPQEYWQDILEQNQIALEASLRAVEAANKSEACQVRSCDCATRSEAAEGRINATYQEKIDGINTAGQTQVDRVRSEGDVAVNVIKTTSNEQVQRVQAEGLTQEQRIKAKGDEQYTRIDTLGTGYLNDINSIGSSHLTDINNAAKTGLEQINSTKDSILTQITDTGNYQASRVTTVGNDTVQRVREEANVAVGQADRAKKEADRAKEEADRAQHIVMGELPIATHVIQGITRLATTEEHLAGENDTIATTPLGVRQMVQQFTSVTIDGPTITGPDNVREQSTHTYAFWAKALLPNAKIAKFIYHIDELNTTATEVPVPAAQQAAEVTLDVPVTFPGGLGTINTLIIYAVDSYGNTSRYAMKAVSIRLNEPPIMSGFTHNIPAFVANKKTYTIKMSGATDPDGDPITYKFDFGSTGITATPNNGIKDNQNVSLVIPNLTANVNPQILTFKVLAVDSLGATNEVSITLSVITKFKIPTIGSPVSGQTDFSPKGTISWSSPSIDHDVMVPEKTIIEVATDTAFTNKVVYQELVGVATSYTGVLPYNKQLYTRVSYAAPTYGIFSGYSPTVNFTTKVTTPTPKMTIFASQESSMQLCRSGNTLAPGATISSSQITNNQVAVSYSTDNNAVSPTGEMPIKINFQAASTNTFTNPYSEDLDPAELPSYPICESLVFENALNSGKISAGNPAKLAYFRLRFNYGTVGPTGNTITLTSPWSNVQSNGILSASLTVPVLTAPANNAIDQNEASLTLSWNNGTAVGQSITRVQVQVYDDVTMTTVVKDSGNLAGSATSWTVTGLDLGHEYFWAVRNYGSATGWTDWSSPRSFTTFEHLFTSNISITAPANNATNIPRKQALTIRWSEPTYRSGDLAIDFLMYNVSISQGSKVVFTKEGIAGTSVTVPANTLTAAKTKHTINVVAYFDSSKVNSTDKHYTTRGSSAFTTTEAKITKLFTASGTYTVPTTGRYRLCVVGAGGGANIKNIYTDDGETINAPGGGGAGGYVEGKLDLTSGTILQVTVGASTVNGTTAGNSIMKVDKQLIQLTGNGGGFGNNSIDNITGGAGGKWATAGTFIDLANTDGGKGGDGYAFKNGCATTKPSSSPGALTGSTSYSGYAVAQGAPSTCVTSGGVTTVTGFSGGGGGVRTPMGKNYGGGAGYHMGNTNAIPANPSVGTAVAGQNGACYIESTWGE